ncbi:hypothetical protein AMIS_61300 [Actinoplanes missouriensis 431]|uniref:Uncharacterized protein n=1 Tax=Actinoplanes missouriensis (strain ATCC 14538 / DSM 43046 / CBS 188.64 / JCM 3121 / NBRC 102363 / NCIMB 12654 / NRRL B-3342 / UNCC 431) TaxID=512565 RepID=I0HEB3_ACTM4|nr:hypothetical protein [Actinoplanes missouriensis]BAL91350.1 hypothetical protein AMIS_61300 [Actinoplanes missouriensis 431]
MISRRGLLLLSLMCGAGVLWSATLIVSLAAGARPFAAAVAVGVAAFLTVPGFAAGVLSNRRGYRTRQPMRPWRLASWVPPHVPHWAAITAGLVFFGFWLAVVLAFAALDGNPAMKDGRYVLEDHDRVIEVNQEVYERQSDHQQQISLGVLGAFAVGGSFLCAARATDHEH